MKQVLCINTGGVGDLHGYRMRALTEGLPYACTYHDLDRSRSRRENAQRVMGWLREQAWDLVYMESTGISAGGPLIRAARAWGQRYVVSSGDPIGGFFRTTKGPAWGAAFEVYERLLYRHAAGFIGWTPYLAGMALRMGAPKAATVEGAADLTRFRPPSAEERLAARAAYGIAPDHLVCGIVGSLIWTPRQGYCYGLELVETLRFLTRTDVTMLVVGDGDGRAELERRVPAKARDRIRFTGRVPFDEVPRVLHAMDVGFITQTLDDLGRYRLTTKLPEYLGAGLPVAMSPVPGFFDYVLPAGWALPSYHPASEAFHRACAAWLDGLTWADVAARAAQARPQAEARFDYGRIRATFQGFLHHLLEEVS